MKLAAKITLIGILTISFIVIIMLIIAITTSKKGLVEKIGESQLELTKSTMENIDTIMYYNLQEIRAMAEDEEFEGALSGEEDFTESIKKLKELSFLTGPWDDLEIFNNEGVVVASSDYDNIGDHLKEQSNIENEAFNIAIKGELFYSSLVISEETNRPTVVFAAPIRNPNQPGNPVVGVVIGNFAWPVIQDILFQFEEEVHVHLFDNEGILLASNEQEDQSKILTDVYGSFSREHILENKDSYHIDINNEGTFEVLESHSIQKGYLSYKGKGWILYIETPTEVAFASVQKTTRNLLIASLFVIIITIIVSFLVARNISTPIVRLKNSADKISKGNLGEIIEFKGSDEISELAESFDNMRYSLKMVIEEYEKMKGGAELQKNLSDLEKKQAQTIKKLRISIAEQKLASSAEQKALKKYNEMEKKMESTLNTSKNILNKRDKKNAKNTTKK